MTFKVSPAEVKVGDSVTITGSVKILETWPYTLDQPQTAYITPVVPGPVFVLTDRTVNGAQDFGSIFIDKGDIYHITMVMKARTPGQLARPSGNRDSGHRHIAGSR